MSISTELRSQLDKICQGQITYDAPMSEHTSFQIGGPADALAEPTNAEQIAQILSACRKCSAPVFVMGNGSNLLVSDSGIRAVVIKCDEKFAHAQVDGQTVTAESGILLSKLSRLAADAGLAGLEFAAGIPGTLGGAVYMNAGAYDGEMRLVVSSTTYYDPSNEAVHVLSGEAHSFGYRKSFFSGSDKIILKSTLSLRQGEPAEIRAKMSDFNARRRAKQPLNLPSCGSTFKRPKGYYAGALIQGCGLMGYSIGGAAVSTKHAGFVVNTGGATAADVRALITHIQHEVRAKYGVELECEVRMVGFD